MNRTMKKKDNITMRKKNTKKDRKNQTKIRKTIGNNKNKKNEQTYERK